MPAWLCRYGLPLNNYKLVYFVDVLGITFPIGVVLEPETNELRIYYGAADKYVAVATASVTELIKALRSESV